MSTLRSVCVFCGSSGGGDPAHTADARRLGASIAGRGLRLVFGGGRTGLMKAVADAVVQAGGEAIGVIPRALYEREAGHAGIGELVVVESMLERKRQMLELSDAFVVLPGGLGTLDEFFEIVTGRQLGSHRKPIVLLDAQGFWRPLRRLVEAVAAGGFVEEQITGLFTMVESPDDVLPALRAAAGQCGSGPGSVPR